MSVPLKILLVEDDEEDVWLVRDLLRNVEGYIPQIEWESKFERGLERLQQEAFDICLVDYRIGAETGIDFIIDANRLACDVPLILITGVSDRRIDLEAVEAGAANFIDKASVTEASLERAIRYSMARTAHSISTRSKSNAERLRLDEEIQRAITGNQFELFIQPIICCNTLQIRKVEGLVRWNHPKHGMLGPGHFIDAAEESGMIVGIGKIVLNEVCRIASRMNTFGHNLKFAVNVSIAQVERSDFVETVEAALAANKTNPSHIELEITESVAMSEPQKVLSHMQALRSIGIRFAVDDFGTGFSGLATIKDFPFDTIKIDRAFIQTSEMNDRSRATAKTIFYLADQMNLETVAEGVETADQFAMVRDYGAAFVQGFLVSKPLSFDNFQVFSQRYRQRIGLDLQHVGSQNKVAAM